MEKDANAPQPGRAFPGPHRFSPHADTNTDTDRDTDIEKTQRRTEGREGKLKGGEGLRGGKCAATSGKHAETCGGNRPCPPSFGEHQEATKENHGKNATKFTNVQHKHVKEQIGPKPT